MLILVFWGAFIAALWISLLIWTYRGIRSRARDMSTRILAVLSVDEVLEFITDNTSMDV